MLDASNRRGRAIACRASILPLRSYRDGDGEAPGAILLMEELTVNGADDPGGS